ncbi:hypothetical protein KC19_4G225400 [Ceratodon purpureus]|uniref:Uncharacterized protein n=1 Tax=Ceratodon purpureus TaxID=3225 RepID=A0A8T0IDZ6_CERPU|nr:hypothetical protein KC19_4G225400 [Ceratodon purpureus]
MIQTWFEVDLCALMSILCIFVHFCEGCEVTFCQTNLLLLHKCILRCCNMT